jgi:hypothetical protein
MNGRRRRSVWASYPRSAFTSALVASGDYVPVASLYSSHRARPRSSIARGYFARTTWVA